MKRLLAVAVFAVVLLTPSQAQDLVAIPLDDVDAHGISISRLDSLHGPAVYIDPSQSVFPEQQAEVVEEWRALLGALSERLHESGFEWSDPLRGYYRFYFRPDGTVESVLYRVQELDGDRASHYGRILNEFAQSYQFGLSADRGFSQCSPATLMPRGE